ncbi:MAG: hypothetical protein ACRDH2_05760, partial [Anaerolineales bacterium]
MFPHFRPSLRWIALGLLVVWLILIINLPLGMLAGGTSNAPASNPYQLNRAGPASEGEGEASEPGRVNASKGSGLAIGPILGEPVVSASFDGDLRDLPHDPPTEERLLPEFESPFEEAHEASLPSNAADPVAQNWDGSVRMPSPSQSFKGISRSSGGSGWPPDTNGDVGPNHYIQTVNTSLAIYS